MNTNASSTRSLLITGASSGIGRATALELARDGGQLTLAGRDRQRLTDTAAEVITRGGRVQTLSVDLRDPLNPGLLVERAASWAGRLDAVVSCAGSFPGQPFVELDDERWEETLALNLTAPMRLFRAATPHLQSAGGGVLALVSSINAHIGDLASVCSAYSAAKAGQEGMIRQLAVELASSQIRTVAVAPGVVDTPMLDGWNDEPRKLNVWLERYVPLQRMAHPEEIAKIIRFMVSRDASYITGQTIMVDGGMSIV